MERHGRPRRRPEAPSAPTTLTEITRRYYATAIALSKAMGVPLSETFIREHRESISCCFIEAGRAGVRLPPSVQLRPLSEPTVEAPAEAGEIMCSGMPPTPEASTTEDAAVGRQDRLPADPSANGTVPSDGTVVPSPTMSPTEAGLPCGGALIVDLTPPQLHMLVSKVGFRMLAEPTYAPLLSALQSERAKRLERGRKVPTSEGAADVP
jgi:hypothetical protein